MKVENNEIILTNREYFTKFCYFYGNDLCQIWRMWLKWLDKTVGRDAPMWEKKPSTKSSWTQNLARQNGMPQNSRRKLGLRVHSLQKSKGE